VARTRTIKPETHLDPDLNALSFPARWLFVGLWGRADALGRLEDDARRIKVEVMPYDDVNVEALLEALAGSGFIIRYEVEERRYIQITNFLKHQRPHPKEATSSIPAAENLQKIKKRLDAVKLQGRIAAQPCNFTEGSPVSTSTSTSDPESTSGAADAARLSPPAEAPPDEDPGQVDEVTDDDLPPEPAGQPNGKATVRQLEALIREEHISLQGEDGDVRESVKRAASHLGLRFDARSVSAAIDSMRFKRKRDLGRAP
jgi:hypothetical protein